MKRLIAIFVVGLSAATLAGTADTRPAETSKTTSDAKKITGKNECASCEGLTNTSIYDVLLVEKDGTRWVLVGSGPSYDAAMDGHNEGKTITATLAGEPINKAGMNGQPYKEVKVSDIRIAG